MVRRAVRWILCFYAVACLLWATGWSDPEIDEFWTWSQFLKWMASPGGISLVVGILLSVGVEYIRLYEELDKKWKRAVFFGLCLIVPLLATGMGVWTDEWPATWRDTFWPALWAGGLAFASGTMAHGYLPKLPIYPKAPANQT